MTQRLGMDAASIGLIRESLIESLGEAPAREAVVRFGFVRGWQAAGDPSHELHESLSQLVGADDARAHLFGSSGVSIADSVEAGEHLLRFGQSTRPVCDLLCGLASGFQSRASGRTCRIVEDRCRARGDPSCHLVAGPSEAWGEWRETARAFGFDAPARSDEPSTWRTAALVPALRAHQRALVESIREVGEPLGIVARSSAMRKLVRAARHAAATECSVLVTGEGGASKHRIARLVHDSSSRRRGPFVVVDCSTKPPSLLERELFGYRETRPDGSVRARPGLFEAADTGTLLLRHVDQMGPSAQRSLSTLLRRGWQRPHGETERRHLNLRIIATANGHLEESVTRGSFDPGLLERLSDVVVHMPSLSERREDIVPLAQMLLAGSVQRMNGMVTGLGPHVADQLVRYSWPGSLRELDQVIEHAVAHAPGSRLRLVDLPEAIRTAGPRAETAAHGVRPLGDIEREYILAALELNGGHRGRTADQLRIGRSTLRRKLRAYDANPR